MKRFGAAWVIACWTLVLFASGLGAQERSLRISEFDATLEVGADGMLDVTEKITVEFKGQWNGVRRELLLRHNTAQGRRVRLDVDVGEITDSAGRPLTVERESGDGTLILRIYVPDNRDATRQVVIRYRVSNAIRFFYADSDVGELDELYWNVTGNSTEWPTTRVRARVVLPPNVRPTRVAVYTGPEHSQAAEADIERSGNVVTFTARRELQAYEGMTVAVGWPPGAIASRPSARAQRTLEVVRWWPAALPFLVFFLAFRAWSSRGRDPDEGAIAVQYEPVTGLSPAEMGTLVDHRAEMRDITATLVDLAVRGYVRIEETRERKLLGLLSDTEFHFHLRKPREEWSGLAGHEERYLDALFEGSSSVKLSDLQNKFYKSLPGIRDALYDQLVARDFYKRRPDSVKNNWLGGGALVLAAGVGAAFWAAATTASWASPAALGIAGVVSGLTLLVFAPLMPARTTDGARARGGAGLSRISEPRGERPVQAHDHVT